jgi:hypothetical protein
LQKIKIYEEESARRLRGMHKTGGRKLRLIGEIFSKRREPEKQE